MNYRGGRFSAPHPSGWRRSVDQVSFDPDQELADDIHDIRRKEDDADHGVDAIKRPGVALGKKSRDSLSQINPTDNAPLRPLARDLEYPESLGC